MVMVIKQSITAAYFLAYNNLHVTTSICYQGKHIRLICLQGIHSRNSIALVSSAVHVWGWAIEHPSAVGNSCINFSWTSACCEKFIGLVQKQ